jgi:hypothetical protein
MPTNPAGDVALTPLSGKGDERTVSQLLTTFHLGLVILDPYAYESAWLLETAGRILEQFKEADVRTGFVVCAPVEDARSFLGPWSDTVFCLADPTGALPKSMALESLPAFVHIGQDGTLLGWAEGWDPDAWKSVTGNLAKAMSWRAPVIPADGDPAPYQGAPISV